MPQHLRTRRHARKTETVARPLFPRYLFVRMDLSRDRWRSVQSTFGVQSLVWVGERPGAISQDLITELRARENAAGYVEVESKPFNKGEKIRILDGIFEDSVGTFQRNADKYRVAVLLQLLGREVMTLVPDESITAA